MNILKHMEATFVAALFIAVTGSSMIDALPEAHAKAAPTAIAATSVPVVVVKAKRMSDAEKAASLAAERQLASRS